MYKYILPLLLLACTNENVLPESNNGEVDSNSVPGLSEGYPTFRVVVDENLNDYFKALVRESLKDWSNSTRCMNWFVEYKSINIKDIYNQMKLNLSSDSYTIYFMGGSVYDYPNKAAGTEWIGQGHFYTQNNHVNHRGFAFIDSHIMDGGTDRTVRHELGHAMGMNHNETNRYAIMKPGYDSDNLHVLQVADVWQFRDYWNCK